MQAMDATDAVKAGELVQKILAATVPPPASRGDAE
jgi:hypothetical protein